MYDQSVEQLSLNHCLRLDAFTGIYQRLRIVKLPILKKIDRYILTEIIPQFFSMLFILCSILVVSQLIRLSEMIVALGITVENVVMPIVYITLPFLSFNIPIAYLGAVLFTYSRLSSDGEYAAMLAAGLSLKRSAATVVGFAVALFFVASLVASYLEPWGRRELTNFYHRKTQTELDNVIQFKMQSGVFIEDFLGYTFYAEHISDNKKDFQNVLMVPKNNAAGNFFILAPTAHFIGSVTDGSLHFEFLQGMIRSGSIPQSESTVVKFQRMDLDILQLFSQQIFSGEDLSLDYRSYPPNELLQWIKAAKTKKDFNEGEYRRAVFLFHQRISTPFAVVVFAFFGLILGVTDPRKGKNFAYIYAILSIIGSYVIIMGFKWFAENTHFPAVLAAWLPFVILILGCSFLLYQKNRLPPSESILDFRNLPFRRRFPRRLTRQ